LYLFSAQVVKRQLVRKNKMKKINHWQICSLVSVVVTLVVILIIQIFHVSATSNNDEAQRNDVINSDLVEKRIYQLFEGASLPRFDIFQKALTGYAQLKQHGLLSNDTLLTIIDFRLSSNEKRMWVLDLKNKLVLYNCLVAHGRNSGEEYAINFSNTPESYQSSIGFYITGEVYEGKHGISLYLDGVERGFNDKARDRYIVIHGADYVSEQFIKENGRLGRSHGCPAIPRELEKEIIPLIARKSCLFIYAPVKKYDLASVLINTTVTPDMLAKI
jgi:hypothetical protein